MYFLANPDGYFGQDDRGLLRAHYAGDLVYKASGYAMLRLFLKLLRNKDGYTAVECGILSSLAVIFAEKLALNHLVTEACIDPARGRSLALASDQ